ncbi:MAG: hypothetical protein ACOX9E_10155 [Lentisphaeria bacterium]|jgi:exopolyphosphatase/guanosine-5'-triphosphate,3'-diphosphate pyrophosphatase
MATTTFAALDIGSNTIMTLVLQVGEQGELHVVDEFGEVTQLGAGANAENRYCLREEAMARSLAAANRQLQHLRQRYRHFTLVAAATSAVREAPNGTAFMRRCQQELVLDEAPTILSGDLEAEACFLGAATAFAPDQTFINIDPGGGSTEFSGGKPGQLHHAFSLPIGCVRWRDRFGLSEVFDKDTRERAAQAVHDAINSAAGAHNTLQQAAGAGAVLSASGGTAATLGAVLLGRHEFDRQLIHRRPCGRTDINDMLKRVAAMTCAARQDLPGMPPGRASVFPAGLIIMCSVMDMLGHDELIINCHGLRHGLIVLLRQGRLAPQLSV